MTKHYTCGACDHGWSRTDVEQLSMRQMALACPRCGSLDVSESFLPFPPQPKKESP
mgnify:CR=1 FL=1